jgi:HEAT repeat protein
LTVQGDLGHLCKVEGTEAQGVRAWFRDVVTGLKGLRVYAENNETLQLYLARIWDGLQRLHETEGELSLSIREDRILHAGEPVLVSEDRREGLPFLLYRNAFRRLTLASGMSRDELFAFLRALAHEGMARGEDDLVSVLWRLELPHLRYVTIDTLTAAAGTAPTRDEKADIERLQSEVESIVAAVYRSNTSGDDIVAGVSITKEDLEALKEIREEPEDLDSLDTITERAIFDVPAEDLERFTQALERESKDALIRRTMRVLLQILFQEQSGQDAFGAIDLLQQLMDSLLLDQRFVHATELVRLLNLHAQDTSDMQRMHVSRQLLVLFSSKSRIVPLLAALNDRALARSVSELVGFLRALGPGTVPAMLQALPNVESPVHRRVVRDLIIDLGVPSVHTLHAQLEGAEWFVVRDLLYMAEHHPPGEVGALVDHGLRHAHPRVREGGVKMLRAYGYGLADDRLARMLDDPDPDVRKAARRVAMRRSSPNAAKRIAQMIGAEQLSRLDAREQKELCRVYAHIKGREAVRPLAQLLRPGLLSSFKNTDLPVAAAHALSTLEEPEAKAELQRGARSLVPKIREVCKRALERADERESSGSFKTGDLEESSGEFPTLSLEQAPAFTTELPKVVERTSSVVHRPPPRAPTSFHESLEGRSDVLPEPPSAPPVPTTDLVLTEELVLPDESIEKPTPFSEPPKPRRSSEVLPRVDVQLPDPEGADD